MPRNSIKSALMIVVLALLPAVSAIYRVVTLADATASCGDGSPYRFFISDGSGDQADLWNIFLEGGALCTSATACTTVNSTLSRLFSSSHLADFDISKSPLVFANHLSLDITINPDFASATNIVLPYCTQDLWLGAYNSSNENRSFGFTAGFYNVLKVFEYLAAEYASGPSELLLSGSSAGGIGMTAHAYALLESNYTAGWLNHSKIKLFLDSSLFLNFYDSLVYGLVAGDAIGYLQPADNTTVQGLENNTADGWQVEYARAMAELCRLESQGTPGARCCADVCALEQVRIQIPFQLHCTMIVLD